MTTTGIALIDVDDLRAIRRDVVIVGSGTAAMAVAGQLRVQGISTLLIEAGPAEPRGIGVHARAYDSGPQGGLLAYREAVQARLSPHGGGAEIPGLEGARSTHNVGGGLSYWSHIAVAPHPVLEAEPAVPADRLAVLLERARSILHVGTAVTSHGRRQAHLLRALRAAPGIAGQAVPTPLSATEDLVHGFRFGGGADLLDRQGEGRDLAPVSILPGHVARRVRFTGDRITGITAFSVTTRAEVVISASTVVVAAGAIGTPQLLHASGLRTAGVLGGYLSDHPLATSRVRLRPQLLEGVSADDALFAVTVPVAPGRDFQTSVSRGWHAPPGSIPGELPRLDTADVSFLSGIEPSPENIVWFDDEVLDGFGMPSPRARLQLSSEDRESIHAGLALQHEIASLIGAPSDPWTSTLSAPGGSLHLMGTHRMGAGDDGSSVTDAAGRPWGTSGLRLVGNGSIAARTACNPTLTTVALSLAVADSIAR